MAEYRCGGARSERVGKREPKCLRRGFYHAGRGRKGGFRRSEREAAGENDGRLARVGGANLTDVKEFFAAALELALDGTKIFFGDGENHAQAEVEGAEKLVAFDGTELGEIAEDGKDRPGAQLDNGLHAARENAAKIAGNAASGDMGHAGKPALGYDFFERGPVTAVRHEELGADLVADL